MMSLEGRNPQPSVIVVIAAVLLFIAGGAWFFYQFLGIATIQIRGEEVVGTVEKFYPGKFGIIVSYSYTVASIPMQHELFVIFSEILKPGEKVVVLFDPNSSQSYLKNLVLPNSLAYLAASAVAFEIGVLGFIRKVKKRKDE